MCQQRAKAALCDLDGHPPPQGPLSWAPAGEFLDPGWFVTVVPKEPLTLPKCFPSSLVPWLTSIAEFSVLFSRSLILVRKRSEFIQKSSRYGSWKYTWSRLGQHRIANLPQCPETIRNVFVQCESLEALAV